MKKNIFLLSIALIMTVLIGCSSDDNSSDNNENKEWSPEGNIEFMSSYEPGGGHDTMLRAMSSIMNSENIIENTINVTNKPGGSAAVGIADAASQEGNDNYVFSVTSSFLTTPLQGDTNNSYKDYTPIARLGEDPYILLVNSDSEIKDFKDFEEELKNNELTFGGTASGGGSHLLALQIGDKADANIEYVPFKGDGEVTTALLGGHIDAVADNIGASIEYIENGDMRPIAVSTKERMEDLPDVPTLIELDYDIEWTLFRGIYGPPGMSEEARSWYENKFKELDENEKWQAEYLDQNKVKRGYLNGEEFEEYLEELNGDYETYLRKLGIIE